MTAPRITAILALILMPASTWAATSRTVKISGYLDFRKPGVLVVDGQRVRQSSRTAFRGAGAAKNFDTIPTGYEMRVEGTRQTGGTILATKIDAKPNGTSMLKDVVAATSRRSSST